MKPSKILSLLVSSAMLTSIITVPATKRSSISSMVNAASITYEIDTDSDKIVPTPFGDLEEYNITFHAPNNTYYHLYQKEIYDRIIGFLNSFNWGEKTGEQKNIGTDTNLKPDKYQFYWDVGDIFYKVWIGYDGSVIYRIYRLNGDVDGIFYKIDINAFDKGFNELINRPAYLSKSEIDKLIGGKWKSAVIYDDKSGKSLVARDTDKLDDFLKNGFVPMLRLNIPTNNPASSSGYTIRHIFAKDDKYDHRETYYISGNGILSRCGYDFNDYEDIPTGSENYSIDMAEFEKKLAECGVDIKKTSNMTTTSGNHTAAITTSITTAKTADTTTAAETPSVLPAQTVFKFNGVASYPTKTVYEVGDLLDFSGLKISAALCGDESYTKEVVFSYRDYKLFTVTDKNGKKVSADKFNTLCSGEYTVSYSGVIGSESSSHYIKDVEFSYPVTIKETYRTTATTTTTSTTTTTFTTTTTTTSTTISTIYMTTGYVDSRRFESIISYPTKTVYNAGEDLDIRGIVMNAGYVADGDKYDFRTEKFIITDEKGNSVTGDKFNTLSAGEYTVSYEGSAVYGSAYYGGIIVGGINFSYGVTIREATEEGLKEREEQKEKEMEEENDPDPSYGFVWGDANLDGCVDMADAVLIMQSLANPNKYGLLGTSDMHIRKSGLIRGDVDISTAGLTSNDALFIQRYLLKKIPTLDPNG